MNKKILVILIIIILLASLIFYIVFIESKKNNDKDHKKQFDKPKYPPLGPITLQDNKSLTIVFGAFESGNTPVPNAKISLFLHNITLTNYTEDNGFAGFEINFSVPKNLYEVRTEAKDYDPLIYKIELEILDKNK